MTREQLRDVLQHYARGLVELSRRSRELHDPRLAVLLEEAITALDRARAGLHSPGGEPDDDPLEFVVFALAREARVLVEAALVRASELAGSASSRSSCLGLVALDFVGTNDFRFADAEQRRRFFQKYERLMSVKIIVVDSTVGEVIYGIDTLAKLASEDGGPNTGPIA